MNDENRCACQCESCEGNETTDILCDPCLRHQEDYYEELTSGPDE